MNKIVDNFTLNIDQLTFFLINTELFLSNTALSADVYHLKRSFGVLMRFFFRDQIIIIKTQTIGFKLQYLEKSDFIFNS